MREYCEGLYYLGFCITSLVVFLGCWVYCIAEYGFLLGVGLGWLPSGIVAMIAGAIWPLLALALWVFFAGTK